MWRCRACSLIQAFSWGFFERALFEFAIPRRVGGRSWAQHPFFWCLLGVSVGPCANLATSLKPLILFGVEPMPGSIALISGFLGAAFNYQTMFLVGCLSFPNIGLHNQNLQKRWCWLFMVCLAAKVKFLGFAALCRLLCFWV